MKAEPFIHAVMDIMPMQSTLMEQTSKDVCRKQLLWLGLYVTPFSMDMLAEIGGEDKGIIFKGGIRRGTERHIGYIFPESTGIKAIQEYEGIITIDFNKEIHPKSSATIELPFATVDEFLTAIKIGGGELEWADRIVEQFFS